jgi:hypothetical protein
MDFYAYILNDVTDIFIKLHYFCYSIMFHMRKYS